jgi:hypothetical protein
MADEQQKNSGKELPNGIGAQEIYAKGRPVSLADIFEPEAVEYARAPGLRDGQVFVIQSLTAGDLIEWSEASEGSEQKRLAGLRLIIKSVVDGEPGTDPGAQGKVLMDESHLGLLKKKSHKKTEAVVKAILKLNGMRVKGDSDAKND